MRIFIKDGHTVEKPTGAKTIYAINSFNEVDDELGKQLIAEGIARGASKDNVADPEPEPEPEVLPEDPTPTDAEDDTASEPEKKDRGFFGRITDPDEPQEM